MMTRLVYLRGISEHMIDDVDDVVSKLNRMIKNLDTPSPCNGRNVANALRELRNDLCEAIARAQEQL